MAALSSKPGFTASIVGTILLVNVVFVRLLFSATSEKVYLAGRSFGAACSFKQQTGYPCPTCGMTRSVVLSLHGNLKEAVAINPTGTVALFGVLFFIAAMFFLAIYQQTHTKEKVLRLEQYIRSVMTGYVILLITVWLGFWLFEMFHY
jgi:hypothetical protein